MAKKEKKPFSITSLLLMVVSVLFMIFAIYIIPYLLADANSTGWYETGRYAHANLYPGLAIQSYTEALRRFPDPLAFPQGSFINEAKNLLFSLKQGLSGIPFRSIYDLLVRKDFQGLRELLQSGALSMANLEVGRLSAAGKARLALDLKKVRAYIDRILLFRDDQNRPRYSGNYVYHGLADLKKQFRARYTALKEIFVKSDIFVKADFPGLDAVFNEDKNILDTLSVANVPAVKAALRSRLKSLSLYLKRLLKRQHIDFVKQVDIRIDELKRKTELLKAMLNEDLYNRIWNEEFEKLKNVGGADQLTDGMLQSMYDNFSRTVKKVLKLVATIARKSKELEAHLKSDGRTGVTIVQVINYEEVLTSATFKVPGFADFKRQAGIYVAKMAQIKTRMLKLKQEKDDIQMKEITARGAQRAALKVTSRQLRKQYQEARDQYEGGKFLPAFVLARAAFATQNSSFNAYCEQLKKPFANAEGEVTAFRRIEELCKLPVLTFATAFDRVQISREKKFMILGEDPRTADQMSNGIDAMFEGIFNQFLNKTMAHIKSFIEIGKVDELKAFLQQSSYYGHLAKKYIKEHGYRIDYIRHGIKDSASSESILKRILKFRHFYDGNGVLGDRAETLKLNRLYLVPLAIKLIKDGGLMAKYKDLLEDLEEVPPFEGTGSADKGE